MKTYNLTIHLDKNPGFAVPRVGVTAPEVAVLQALHGADAVVDIVEATEPAAEAGFSKSEMRAWLQEKYGAALANSSLALTGVLGPEALALPAEIEGATPAPAQSRRPRAPKVAAPDLADVVTPETMNSDVEPAVE